MGKRFRLITSKEKIIRIRIDKLVEDYKKTDSRLKTDGARKAEARRVVHRGAKHVRPLCNQCLKKVNMVTIDRGKTAEAADIPRFDLIGYWCDNHLHFFYVTPPLSRELCEHKKRKVTIDRSKAIAQEAGISRFSLIGHWCDECKRFDQVKTRRVIIRRED